MTFLFWTAAAWIVLAICLLVVVALAWFQKPPQPRSDWRTSQVEHDRIVEQLATYYPSMRTDRFQRGNRS